MNKSKAARTAAAVKSRSNGTFEAPARAKTPEDWVNEAGERFPSVAEVTPWFPETVRPAREGWYERFFVQDVLLQYWNGQEWTLDGRTAYVKSLGNPLRPCWRGLVRPSTLPT